MIGGVNGIVLVYMQGYITVVQTYARHKYV